MWDMLWPFMEAGEIDMMAEHAACQVKRGVRWTFAGLGGSPAKDIVFDHSAWKQCIVERSMAKKGLRTARTYSYLHHTIGNGRFV